jgi:glutamate synthase (ferredoxin)
MNEHTLEGPDTPTIELEHLLIDPDPTGTLPRRNLQVRNDPPRTKTLDDWLVESTVSAIEHLVPVVLEQAIHNTDRSVGARLAGEIARRYGDQGLPEGTIRVTLHGSAGQSFGAFCIQGVHLTLVGEANDYVGKSMAGGEIVIRPPIGARWATNENHILGNTVLYGATGGALFAAGRAGERYAVRNCGSVSVVEGIGDHGCEYMTGGIVVVLGPPGRNFGAGMTGGTAYVYDIDGKLSVRLNSQLVKMEQLGDAGEPELYALVHRHAAATSSPWARQLLDRWPESLCNFFKISPKG